MEYRKLPHGGEEISVLGLGTSALCSAGEEEIAKTLDLAIESGINHMDLATADGALFAPLGRALAGRREKMRLQLHFGADYSAGAYGWTLDRDAIRASVDWQLKNLQTDYIDFGFLHCIDELSDLETAWGTLEEILRLKDQGVVRRVGLSSHTPAVVNRLLEEKVLDLVMFSINPAYDYSAGGEFAIGGAQERMDLYRRCEAEGVGISVMKAFSGGQILDEKTSPLGCALTEYQCIQYALDKPGVLTVLPGVRGSEDLRRLLGFLDAPASARDYAGIAARAPREIGCVYCNHCAPCPAGLDVGLINKYYDLSRAGDALARDHYAHLARHASDCVGCGHCDGRCPFRVPQSQRMREIAAYFGN